MPYYVDLNEGRDGSPWKSDDAGRLRTIERLISLRKALSEAEGAPPQRTASNLLLASWNIREFDSEKWGPRLAESYAYIAEILSRFDLIAVQEVRANLDALEAVKRRLGSTWSYLVSDVTEGSAGNQERLAFLYDTRKVRFLGIAGELVLPPIEVRGEETVPAQQIARTPLMAAFQVGWTKFVLSTVHIVWGPSEAEPEVRVEEIRQVANFLRKRTEDPDEPIQNFIVLGDFNIFAKDDKTMEALVDDGGFTIPAGIQEIPGTNVPKNKKYDQIAFRSRQGRFEATGRANAFDYYEHLMREEDAGDYRPYIDAYIEERHSSGKSTPKKPSTDEDALDQFLDWRTYQLSDHLPLWAEFRIDFADEYLDDLKSKG